MAFQNHFHYSACLSDLPLPGCSLFTPHWLYGPSCYSPQISKFYRCQFYSFNSHDVRFLSHFMLVPVQMSKLKEAFPEDSLTKCSPPFPTQPFPISLPALLFFKAFVSNENEPEFLLKQFLSFTRMNTLQRQRFILSYSLYYPQCLERILVQIFIFKMNKFALIN